MGGHAGGWRAGSTRLPIHSRRLQRGRRALCLVEGEQRRRQQQQAAPITPRCPSQRGRPAMQGSTPSAWQAAKSEAAERFSQQDWAAAATGYTRALALLREAGLGAPQEQEEEAKLMANRCAAYQGAGEWAAAVADARRAVDLLEQWDKGARRSQNCAHAHKQAGGGAWGADGECPSSAPPATAWYRLGTSLLGRGAAREAMPRTPCRPSKCASRAG